MDDDIIVNYNNLNKLLNVANDNGFYLSQPAFIENDNLVYKRFKEKPDKIFDNSCFIETQFPVFEKNFLENKVMPLIKDYVEEFNFQSGWGLDAVWSSIIDNEKKAIVYGTMCEHCRQVCVNIEGSYYKENNIDPFMEAYEFCKKYNINCKPGKYRGWSKNSYYYDIHFKT
jgi:hypothetical protein